MIAILLSLVACGSPEGAASARDAGRHETPAAQAAPDPAVDLEVGGAACVRTAAGRVRCLGPDRSANPIHDLEGATAFDVGGPFGCALVRDGEVRCWATQTTYAAMHQVPNAYGQLGRAGARALFGAAKIEDLAPATAVATGGAHACAIVAGGDVFCWGANQSGQLGDGTTAGAGGPVRAGTPAQPIIAGEAEPEARPRPSKVSGIAGARAIALGGRHSCALEGDGTVRCWGANDHGQLGDGTRETRLAPAGVAGLANVTAIEAGGSTTCARLADRSVRCWGANDHGQVGDGTREDRPSPVAIDALAGAEAISLGSSHGCARFEAGRVRCWGERSYGECGGGPGEDALVPMDVAGIAGADEVEAGGGASFARVGPEVRVWGTFSLEDDGPHHVVATPTKVELPPAAEVAVGQRFSCARLAGDGGVRCWGIDVEGELGDANTAVVRTAPSPVPGIEHATDLSTSVFGACAVLSDGTVRCWGDVDPSDRTPESLAPWKPTGVAGAVEVAAGPRFFQSCARLRNGRVACWKKGEPPREVPGALATKAIAVGSEHACALGENGGVVCWGSGYYGQLGDGTTSGRRDEARPVEPIAGAVEIAIAHNLTIARLGDGSLSWWGESGRERRARPETVDGLGPAQSAGGSCAWLASGELRCGYAYESFAPIAGAEWTLALPASDLSGATQVAITSGHACAVFGGGEVRCWGENGNGEVRPGANVHATPTAVEALR